MTNLTPEERIARAMKEDAQTQTVHVRERHLQHTGVQAADEGQENVGTDPAETKVIEPNAKSTDLAYQDPIDPAHIANRRGENYVGQPGVTVDGASAMQGVQTRAINDTQISTPNEPHQVNESYQPPYLDVEAGVQPGRVINQGQGASINDLASAQDRILKDHKDSSSPLAPPFPSAVSAEVQKEIQAMKDRGEIPDGPPKAVIVTVGGEDQAVSKYNRHADGLVVQEGDGQHDGLTAEERAERQKKLAEELAEDPKHGLSVQQGDGQRRAKDNPRFGETGHGMPIHRPGDAVDPSPVSPQGPTVIPDAIPLEVQQASDRLDPLLNGTVAKSAVDVLSNDTPFDPSPTSPQGPGSVDGGGKAAFEARYGVGAGEDPADPNAVVNSVTPADNTDAQLVNTDDQVEQRHKLNNHENSGGGANPLVTDSQGGVPMGDVTGDTNPSPVSPQGGATPPDQMTTNQKYDAAIAYDKAHAASDIYTEQHRPRADVVNAGLPPENDGMTGVPVNDGIGALAETQASEAQTRDDAEHQKDVKDVTFGAETTGDPQERVIAPFNVRNNDSGTAVSPQGTMGGAGITQAEMTGQDKDIASEAAAKAETQDERNAATTKAAQTAAPSRPDSYGTSGGPVEPADTTSTDEDDSDEDGEDDDGSESDTDATTQDDVNASDEDKAAKAAALNADRSRFVKKGKGKKAKK